MSAVKRPRGATTAGRAGPRGGLIYLTIRQVQKDRHLLAIALLGCLALGVSLRPEAMLEPAPTTAPTESPKSPPVQASALPESVVAATPAVVPPAPEPAWDDQSVRPGDNLSLIFKRAGYSDADVYRVTKAPHGKGLAHIYPGQTIAFRGDDTGDLLAVRHVKNPLETVEYRREESGFTSEIHQRRPEVRWSTAAGVITSSLYMAGKNAGLSTNTIMEMANIFGGVIDFVGDPRQGDTMHLVFEEKYLDGKKFADGAILAASYTNRGKTFTAYRYTDSAGDVGYYDAQGVSMRRAFLLAPVDFTRISSNFNPRRLHPVLGTPRPHRGTDYAAPRGTPVYAAGDGRVIRAGYSRANGNYVFIKHGEQFETKYLHLNKRRVKQGDRVTQGQTIGTVGSTGLATGPHLHYEFLMNGVHRNPRTIHKYLPKAKSLPAEEMTAFLSAIARAEGQLAQLQHNSATRLAMSDTSNGPG